MKHIDYIVKLLKQIETGKKILSPHFQLFRNVSKQTETKKGENSRPHIWCFETLKHIDYIVKLLKQSETGKKYLSPHFQLFRNVSKQTETKKGENSSPHIWCFETLKHIGYIVKLLKQSETGKKFLSPHFQLFRNVSKQTETKKGENSRPHIWCFETLKHIDYIVKLLKQSETGKKYLSPHFQLFRNVSKQTETKKGENSRPHIWCFETLKHIDYIVKLLKQSETGKKFLSPHFQLFQNVSKQTETKKGENSRPHIWCFETLKHIDYIVELLKQSETGKKISKSTVSIVSKRFARQTETKKGENSRPHIWCFETLKHIDYIVKLLKQIETGKKILSPHFNCFETFRNKLKQKKVKNSRPHIWCFETLKHIDYIVKLLKQSETGKKYLSPHFQLFRNVSKQTEKKKGETFGPHIWCFETLKHIDYIVELLKQSETGKKNSKFTVSIVSKRFARQTETKKGENSRPHIWCFETLKHIDYIVKLLKQSETGKQFLSPHFQLFRNVSKQTETKKGENSSPHIWCFETLKHIDYIVKLLKQSETGKKFLSPHFQLFRNVSKQTETKKVKIPGPISDVSKH